MNHSEHRDEYGHLLCGFNWFWLSLTLLCTLVVVSVVVFLGWRTDRLELNLVRSVQRNDEQHAAMKRTMDDLFDYLRGRDEIRGDTRTSERSR